MKTPTLEAEPAPAVPVTETLPPPPETVPPEICTPFEVVLLAPLVPLSIMVLPELLVLTEPPVMEIPWQAFVVPLADAVILSVRLVPEASTVFAVLKPMPPLPCPVIPVVAVILPVVWKVPPEMVIPFPPPDPPVQFEKTTLPLLVKAAPTRTPAPFAVPLLLAAQLEKVTVPVLAVFQELVVSTP
jgi:hypothetical protein